MSSGIEMIILNLKIIDNLILRRVINIMENIGIIIVKVPVGEKLLEINSTSENFTKLPLTAEIYRILDDI